jgi:hypothetical protein
LASLVHESLSPRTEEVTAKRERRARKKAFMLEKVWLLENV